MRRSSVLILLGGVWFFGSCGRDKASDADVGPVSVLDQTFQTTATQYHIPVRLLKAVTFLESRLNPASSTVLYNNGQWIGPSRGETAMGLSGDVLHMPGDPAQRGSFPLQLRAYGAWLSTAVKGFHLNEAPQSSNELFKWILQVARLHYTGKHAKNARALFARDLISILNQGYTGQYQGQPVILAKEDPVISLNQTDMIIQDLLQMETLGTSKIKSAALVPFGNRDAHPVEQKPEGILVQHCPFSFSTCLDMQDEERDTFFLGAHYLVPQTEELSGIPLQINKHNVAVGMLTPQGAKTYSNRVVLMLVGQAGRIIQGVRNPADPTWYTHWQLSRLGNLIREICLDLEQTQGLDADACQRDVQVQHTTAGQSFHWGDVLDYDPMIFSHYAKNPGPADALHVQLEKTVYEKGETIPFHLTFPLQTQTVEIEQLVRCSENDLRWTMIDSQEVSNLDQLDSFKKFFHVGPNQDGQQFVRIKIYGDQQALLGWDTRSLFLNHVATSGLGGSWSSVCRK